MIQKIQVKNDGERCDVAHDCEPLDAVCWDWTKSKSEKCDPKDTSKEWWWEMWCSTSCEPLDAVCWDWTKVKVRKCDPKDTNKEWWWDLGVQFKLCETSWMQYVRLRLNEEQ